MHDLKDKVAKDCGLARVEDAQKDQRPLKNEGNEVSKGKAQAELEVEYTKTQYRVRAKETFLNEFKLDQSLLNYMN